jgi:hypothetical protein
MGLLAFALALVSFGVSWLVFPFVANDHFRKSLLKDGYVPEEQFDPNAVQRGRTTVNGSVAEEIQKLATLRVQGVLTAVEFEERKSRLLAT